MRAVLWTAYGPPEVLRLEEVPKPSPGEGEILIGVRAAAVTTGDCEVRGLGLPLWIRLPMRLYLGLRRPSRRKVPGLYLAGEVEAVGGGVQRFRPGDRVYASTGLRFGAYAEYARLPERGAVAAMPANTSFEEAASAPLGGLNALHFLTKGEIRPREKVLINGAGGSIGTFAVQLAKHLGAEVTAVDSGEKLDLLRSIGADHVVDYEREDFSRAGEAYDVVLDVVGKGTFSRCLRALKRGGRYLLANPGPSQLLRAPWVSRVVGKRVVFQPAAESAEGLGSLRELIEAGAVRPVVDRRYPLERAAEAHRYVESGRKKGDVVLTVGDVVPAVRPPDGG